MGTITTTTTEGLNTTLSTSLRLNPSPQPRAEAEMGTTTTTTTQVQARESLGKKLDRLKEHAKDVASRHPVAGVAAALAVSAVSAYFLWPVAAPAVAMMKAPEPAACLSPAQRSWRKRSFTTSSCAQWALRQRLPLWRRGTPNFVTGWMFDEVMMLY